MKNKKKVDEVDLIKIFISIWQNRFHIILITIFTLSLGLGYYFLNKQTFVATTKIEKISIFEEDLYHNYNSLINNIKSKIDFSKNFKEINKEYLYSLFIEKINNREALGFALDKYKILDKQKFKNESLYLEAIQRLSLQLVFIPPKNIDGKKGEKIKNFWEIQFKTVDKKKWEQVLEYLNKEINNEIKKELVNQFNIQKQSSESIRNFEIENIDNQITNSKKKYELEKQLRLNFLKDQAAIARELEIKNSTLKVQNFDNGKSSIISSIQIDNNNQYYLNGYSMIEKEIELINIRLNENLITSELINLISDKSDILINNSIEIVEKLFLDTPINKTKDFKAASIIYNNTKFKSSKSLITILALSVFIGLILGLFYALISESIRQYKKN